MVIRRPHDAIVNCSLPNEVTGLSGNHKFWHQSGLGTKRANLAGDRYVSSSVWERTHNPDRDTGTAFRGLTRCHLACLAHWRLCGLEAQDKSVAVAMAKLLGSFAITDQDQKLIKTDCLGLLLVCLEGEKVVVRVLPLSATSDCFTC